MADALASGASGGNPVEVQLLSTAPTENSDSRACLLSLFIVYRKPRHSGVVQKSLSGEQNKNPPNVLR